MGKINEEVSKKQRDCERDLAKAEPALQAAVEALNTLNKVYTSNEMVQVSIFKNKYTYICNLSCLQYTLNS